MGRCSFKACQHLEVTCNDDRLVPGNVVSVEVQRSQVVRMYLGNLAAEVKLCRTPHIFESATNRDTEGSAYILSAHLESHETASAVEHVQIGPPSAIIFIFMMCLQHHQSTRPSVLILEDAGSILKLPSARADSPRWPAHLV